MLVAEGKADILITYCTGALEAQRQNVGQRMVALPDEFAVGADYGLTVVNRASPQAYQFAMFILSVDGQRVLATRLRRPVPAAMIRTVGFAT
jgi:molybdate transport system substrate-binding protein